MAYLDVSDVTLTFKGIAALMGVSFTVEQGTIASLIGPNGAGKTSMLNCISGRYIPDGGSKGPCKISLDGECLLSLPAHKRTELGLSRTFQNIALFKGLSVLDNLMVGRHSQINYGLLSSVFYWGKTVRTEERHRRRVEDVIDFLNLSPIGTSMRDAFPMVCRKGWSSDALSPRNPNSYCSMNLWPA